MEVRLTQASWHEIECDLLVIPLFEDEGSDEEFVSDLDKGLAGLLGELRETEEWLGKRYQCTIVHRPQAGKARRLALLGAGKKESWDSEAVRKTVIRAIGQVRGYKLQTAAVVVRSEGDAAAAAQATAEGVVLAAYSADEYKTIGKSKTLIEEVLLVQEQEGDLERLEEAVRRGQILGEATNLARSLVNQPGNQINPSRLAERSRVVAEKVGLEVEVLGEPEMQEMGMETLLAVAKGSDEPARFIILKHLKDPKSDAPPIVFVGKGVTFDSGGLSLKSAGSMKDMKADKAGACAVLAAMQAIARLQIERNVVGLIPAVENMVSGRAQRPGDVIRSMGGKTVEIVNTDAEGRLILADALCYASELGPEYVVDIATLTGACIIALGSVRAGLFSNNDELCEKLQRAGDRAGERFWRLPLDDEYRKDLESGIADVKNSGSRSAGAISAAKFLQEFVGELSWCHIDMAGVDLYEDSAEGTGATGFGARTLVELASI